jgi:DnaJ domain
MILRLRPLPRPPSHLPLHPHRRCRARIPWLLQIPHKRTFTSTPTTRNNPSSSHYDILGVNSQVSPSDLKKRFYVLSKENHPDLHPGSKEHTTRFQQISESYTILADPEKRKKYDRDVMGTRRNKPRGSEGGFAGSRPATGLSKRRGTFRGPPPSYFGNRAGQAKETNSANNKDNPSSDGNGNGETESSYAWGPEPQFPYTTTFNSQPVYRTQTAEDQRRERRNAAAAAAAAAEYDEAGDFWARFVIVTAVVIVGATIGSLVVGIADASGGSRGGGMVRGDGSLRRPLSGSANANASATSSSSASFGAGGIGGAAGIRGTGSTGIPGASGDEGTGIEKEKS